MKSQIDKKVAIAEKRIGELTKSGDLKKLSESLKSQITKFYETKSLNRLETAKVIYQVSKNKVKIDLSIKSKNYRDYAEVVASAYYAMYYIIHAYLAYRYRTKLRENTRGVHAITLYIIIYYLVKTKKLAQHLFKEYVNTLKTTAQIQKISIEDFQNNAYKYAEIYDKSRSAREEFTYNVTKSAEAEHAKQAIDTAEEFINTIRQLMLQK